MSPPGKVIFDLSIFSSRPVPGEFIMVEYTESLITPDEDGSIAHTANKMSVASGADALHYHHGVVRSFDVDYEAGTAKLVIWPVLSYPSSNVIGGDGLTKIAKITDVTKRNLFIPVPFLPSLQYAHIESTEYFRTSTPASFRSISGGGDEDLNPGGGGGGGVLDTGGYRSKFPAWLIMQRHEELFTTGRMFVRLGGRRVPAITLERLEQYEAFLKDPKSLESNPKVMPLDDDEYDSEDGHVLSSFIDNCTRDVERDVLLWVEAL